MNRKIPKIASRKYGPGYEKEAHKVNICKCCIIKLFVFVCSLSSCSVFSEIVCSSYEYFRPKNLCAVGNLHQYNC